MEEKKITLEDLDKLADALAAKDNRIKELEEENSRLNEELKNSVNLPIKVGSIVYFAYFRVIDYTEKYFIERGKVKAVWLGERKNKIWFEVKYKDGSTLNHSLDEINSAIFLTEDEAKSYVESKEE